MSAAATLAWFALVLPWLLLTPTEHQPGLQRAVHYCHTVPPYALLTPPTFLGRRARAMPHYCVSHLSQGDYKCVVCQSDAALVCTECQDM